MRDVLVKGKDLHPPYVIMVVFVTMLTLSAYMQKQTPHASSQQVGSEQVNQR